MTDAVWSFQWDGISGEVQALGGMLGPVWFTANGHQVQPFAIAPWGDDPQAQRSTLHPIFQVSQHTGATQLHIPSLQSLHTFPVPVEPGSVIAPDQTSDSLNAIKRKDGTTLDASKLPLPDTTEELLAVQLTDGHVRLANPEMGFETTLTWDITTFAHCLLWISNRGRDQYPWNSRFTAIGIEPVAAAFDLGVAHSRNPNSPMGASTAIALTQAKPFKTSYQIAVAPLAAS